jgi:hypothetical protein
MEVFIYLQGRLGANLDEFEDELEVLFAPYGGEVTGTGTGVVGCNFDLTLSQPIEPTAALDLLKQCFARFPSRGLVHVDLFIGEQKQSFSWDEGSA